MRTLAELTQPRTKEEHRAQALEGLKGIGIPRQTNVRGLAPGAGTGFVRFTGYPRAAGKLIVEVVLGGQTGGATWRWSTDGGVSWSGAAATSAAASAVGTTGIAVAFVDGPVGTKAFVAGDRYTVRLSTPNFPATAWQPFSVPLSLLEVNAEGEEERDALISNIAKGGYLETAQGEWLDLYAQSMYGLPRKRGGHTVGKVLLEASELSGPHEFQPGQLYALSIDGKRFYNTDGGTLEIGGTLLLTFIAESAGEDYNVANLAITRLETPIPGVDASNPPVTDTASWVVAQGSNDETDEAYRARCRSRWPALARQPPEEVFIQDALGASSEVTRVYVYPDSAEPGEVVVVVAGPAGAVSAPALAAVEAAVEPDLGLCTTSRVENAVGHPLTINFTVYVEADYREAAEVECVAAIQKLGRDVPITGSTLFHAQLVEDLMGPEGVQNAVVPLPAGDTVFAPGEVPIFTINPTFVEV